MIARLTLWDSIGAFPLEGFSFGLARASPPGLSLSIGRHRPGGEQLRWSVGHDAHQARVRCGKSRPVALPRPAGRGAHFTGAREHPMAFKWTKASRAKLSRSQKARWKERKRQQRRKGAKRSSR